jgi:polyphosphate glucokinase
LTAQHHALGVDIGGTGIKAALVDTRTGRLATRRKRVPTPKPATTDAVAAAVCEVLQGIDPGSFGAVGVGFPSAIKDGGR